VFYRRVPNFVKDINGASGRMQARLDQQARHRASRVLKPMRVWSLRLCLLTGIVLCHITSAHPQSLSGIRLGDPFTVTDRIGFPPAAIERSGPFIIAKWALADGNQLHVTASSHDGKIVYVESDWGGKVAYTDFPGFYFGKTTLTEIFTKLGSNGTIFFRNHYILLRDDGIVFFNSYEISGSIITFVSRILEKTLRRNNKHSKYADDAVLDAVLLGEPEYLFSIWGPHEAYRPSRPELSIDLLQGVERERQSKDRRQRIKEAPSSSTALENTDEVSLMEHGGTFLVPVRVNGRLILDFVLDSGASDVQIPDDVFRTLYRTGTISAADFLGAETYILADGSTAPSARFMLRTLEVGSHAVNDVIASVGSGNSEPLLGQSFLSKLGFWALDNRRQVLVLSDKR
jgi:clan AA aspartic protease (TIGR02281 family)